MSAEQDVTTRSHELSGFTRTYEDMYKHKHMHKYRARLPATQVLSRSSGCPCGPQPLAKCPSDAAPKRPTGPASPVCTEGPGAPPGFSAGACGSGHEGE